MPTIEDRRKTAKNSKPVADEDKAAEPTRVRERATQLLYRSRSNRIIGGVAGGLGEYFRIDPTIVRLFFVVFTVFGGSGVLIYLILWVIIPGKGSKPLGTEESIRENADEIRERANEFADEVRGLSTRQNSRVVAGGLIMLLGLFFLFQNFGFFNFSFGKLWPALLVIFGLIILTRD